MLLQRSCGYRKALFPTGSRKTEVHNELKMFSQKKTGWQAKSGFKNLFPRIENGGK